MPDGNEQILEFADLSVSYGDVRAVRSLSLSIKKGEIVGLVGESGSGKSTVLRAAIGLLRRPGRIVGGSIRYKGNDIAHASRKEWETLRGSGMSYLFQDPTASLDPLYSIRKQFDECVLAHRKLSSAALRQLELDLLKDMGFDDPERILAHYPHELSGGMCQRVVIALGLACEPTLLLADEPTSALDVLAQADVIESLLKARDGKGVAILIASHNMGVVAKTADRIGVMYRGTLVEEGLAQEVLGDPRHPYTQQLMQAIPKADGTLPTVPKAAAFDCSEEADSEGGCVYAHKCPRCHGDCEVPLEWADISESHKTLCRIAEACGVEGKK